MTSVGNPCIIDTYNRKAERADIYGGTGAGGAELDIVEAAGDSASLTVWTAVHEGVVEGDSSDMFLWDDFSAGFHTFALKWDDDFYTFYVDGIVVGHSDFATGTSRVPEEVILSLCAPRTVAIDRSIRRTMEVDYLRIWQKDDGTENN